jgi:hypothetical protein
MQARRAIGKRLEHPNGGQLNFPLESACSASKADRMLYSARNFSFRFWRRAFPGSMHCHYCFASGAARKNATLKFGLCADRRTRLIPVCSKKEGR